MRVRPHWAIPADAGAEGWAPRGLAEPSAEWRPAPPAGAEPGVGPVHPRAPDAAASLPPEALDALMPMHVAIEASGRIGRHGPLLSRLGRAASGLRGADAFEALAFRRPRGLASMEALRAEAGGPLRLALRADPAMQMAGVAAGLPGGGVLLNLSFGLGVVEAVRRHRLTATDFAPTDLAVEMLYLVEANAAVMAESRDLVDRLQGARMAAEAEAQSDALTGLANRRALDGVLAGLIRQRRAFALMALDLDRFKQVNDTLGHAAGDHVLREAAAVMLGVVRSGDVVARAGGDEFAILFPGLVRAERLAEIADRLIEGLEHPIRAEGVECAISASIGVTTTASYGAPDAERMTADADAALYASKEAGRGRATIWTPPEEDAVPRAPGRVRVAPLPSRGGPGD